MKRRCVALLVCCLAGQHAWGAEPAQRDELKRQRLAVEADYARREEGCRHQFVVTPCLDRLRASKQEALNEISAQENALDSAERLKRAEAQKRRLADKAKAAQERQAPRSTPQSPAESTPTLTPHPSLPRAPKAAEKPASSPDLRAQEQRNRAEFEARKREIEAHRAQVEKRNAERAGRKAAKPLPLPASGAE